MSRIRTIKPEFWTSPQIVECSTTARLLFIGLWNFADDGGNIPYSPKQFKMQVFPGDGFTIVEMEEWVSELLKNNLLILYDADGCKYVHISGWKHQKVDRPSYKYPKFDEHSTSIPRTLVEPHPPEGSLREGKKKEDKENKIKEREESIPLTGTVKVSSDGLHKSLIEIHSTWYLNTVGVKYIFKAGKDGAAVKTLIASLGVLVDWKQNGSGETPAEKIKKAWSFILECYPRWSTFHQGQKEISQIVSNLNNIIAAIKHGDKKYYTMDDALQKFMANAAG